MSLNSTLRTLKNKVNLPELANKAAQSVSNFFSLFQSDGKEVGDIVQGFEVIADEGLGTKKETLSPIVGRLSENAGISLKSASSRKGDISTITGQTVVDGFLYSSVSNVNAIGINNTLSSLSSNASGISKIISSIAGGDVSEVLLNNSSTEGIAKEFVKEFSNISDASGDLVSIIQSELNTDVVSSLTGDTNIKSILQNKLGTKFKSSPIPERSIKSSPILVGIDTNKS